MTNKKRVNPGSYTELRMWGAMFNDAQAARIAFENQDRSGTVETEALGPVLALYKEAEKRLEKELAACYRMTVPAGVRQWEQESAGIGEHTLARLLGITGDPRMAYPRHWEGTGTGERHLVDDEPHERLIGQLWQYCGHGAPKNREVKGDAEALMKNGSPDAKKLVHLIAAAMVKTNAIGGSAYRWKYDEVKAQYAEQVHSVPCAGGFSGALYVKCKTHVPDGLPDDVSGAYPVDKASKVKLGYAQKGDPFQPSHVHAIALRHVGKLVLRDLWLACGPVPPHLDNHRHRHAGQGPVRG